VVPFCLLAIIAVLVAVAVIIAIAYPVNLVTRR
jgi:hypothetical protein